MNTPHQFNLYSGEGSTLIERGLVVPEFDDLSKFDAPEGYLAEAGLRNAVNVALTLGQPLLLTGEPGTGKTQLAGAVAYELELGKPEIFYTKTTSIARDLFYKYDALRQFNDAQILKSTHEVEHYITYEALGRAIIRSKSEQKRSVVLIDEIDKAPRDLPNDILNEIENLSFEVKETSNIYTADPKYPPIVILTSNSEKNLPDPFLRRVIFYHITFPTRSRLIEIVRRRFGDRATMAPKKQEQVIDHFIRIRDLGLKKKPATAEFLAWIGIVDKLNIDVNDPAPENIERLLLSYSIVVKSAEDMEKLRRELLPR
ncbi:MAG: MoxR family ATPase [Blastocatellia bacterium]|nr:MoxR family ATPase [Blastocatellia bacterium]